MKTFIQFWIASVFITIPLAAATLKVDQPWGNHMVIQANRVVTVNGVASPHARVSLAIHKITVEAQADKNGRLNKAIDEAGPNVHFVGVIDLEKMRMFYNAADLFFFPSVQENCSLAINEAAACGIPMLLRNNPEHAELYGEGRFLTASDGDGFSDQVQKFFKSPKLRKELQEKSKKIALDFGTDTFVETLVGFYREVHEAWSKNHS